ncbi:MAG: DNA circularization N-terminal domain-containing protein [Treponema sp.]|nr:DNA circularization N-terminal domain-containing protein [Treponema sp.]
MAIRDGRYTSPSGNVYTFSYGDVSRETELKTGVYTFPMRDGARVQHQGRGAMTFPLTCIFHGANCMERASAFEEALIERGAGELQHPIYGTFRVKPTGNISRDDRLVTSSNQSTVTVTFTESIENDDDNTMNEVAANTINANHDTLENLAAEDFAAAIASIESVSEQLAIEAALGMQTQSIIDSLQPMAMSDRRTFVDWLASANELRSSVTQIFNRGMAIAQSIEDIYVRALNVARLTLRLMRLPARLSTTLASKIAGYAELTANLINQFRNDPFEIRKIKNAFATATLGISGALASISSGAAISAAEAAASPGNNAVQSTTSGSTAGVLQDDDGGNYSATVKNSGTASREEAVETAASILEMMDSLTAFSDAKIEALNESSASIQAQSAKDIYIDANAASYIALKELVQQSAQLIMNASFALPMQRTFTLDRDRQVIELCAELYNTVDYVDNFIISNNLSIDEIELLPIGTKVTHYV